MPLPPLPPSPFWAVVSRASQPTVARAAATISESMVFFTVIPSLQSDGRARANGECSLAVIMPSEGFFMTVLGRS
ncbi:hypothetical protein D3C85_1875080 [compost metagenome]